MLSTQFLPMTSLIQGERSTTVLQPQLIVTPLKLSQPLLVAMKYYYFNGAINSFVRLI